MLLPLCSLCHPSNPAARNLNRPTLLLLFGAPLLRRTAHSFQGSDHQGRVAAAVRIQRNTFLVSLPEYRPSLASHWLRRRFETHTDTDTDTDTQLATHSSNTPPHSLRRRRRDTHTRTPPTLWLLSALSLLTFSRSLSRGAAWLAPLTYPSSSLHSKPASRP